MSITDLQIKKFQTKIWNYYQEHGREFVWRKTITPYFIVVSELMLQQTQTKRVAEKFPEFIKKFPNFKALAEAPTAEVILAWQGLGYNRRALYLRELARQVMTEHKGQLPRDPAQLVELRGIGKNTAGSIAAFAFNIPTIFIETNIRSVFLHEFFPGQEGVPDSELIPLIAATVPPTQAREWYWALMDYGVMLKKSNKNPSRASKHHAKQSKFIGSKRQIRGEILRRLSEGPLSLRKLEKAVRKLEFTRLDELPIILKELITEGFIERQEGMFRLKLS